MFPCLWLWCPRCAPDSAHSVTCAVSLAHLPQRPEEAVTCDDGWVQGPKLSTPSPHPGPGRPDWPPGPSSTRCPQLCTGVLFFLSAFLIPFFLKLHDWFLQEWCWLGPGTHLSLLPTLPHCSQGKRLPETQPGLVISRLWGIGAACTLQMGCSGERSMSAAFSESSGHIHNVRDDQESTPRSAWGGDSVGGLSGTAHQLRDAG